MTTFSSTRMEPFIFSRTSTTGVAGTTEASFTTHRPRQEVHLSDFDSDGKCDVLLVDKTSGATRLMLNAYDGSTFAFEDKGIVTGRATCTEGYGRGKHDLGVRWHDLTGDKRADMLCIKSDGTVTGYINKGINDLVDQGTIVESQGRERANLRFADINGDGRTDLLFVNMTDGAVTAWYNDGWNLSAKNAFRWNSQGIISPGGFSRGATIELAALNSSRADYISVKPSTNEAWTWFNVCPGSEGPAAPNLPSDAPPIQRLYRTRSKAPHRPLAQRSPMLSCLRRRLRSLPPL